MQVRTAIVRTSALIAACSTENSAPLPAQDLQVAFAHGQIGPGWCVPVLISNEGDSPVFTPDLSLSVGNERVPLPFFPPCLEGCEAIPPRDTLIGFVEIPSELDGSNLPLQLNLMDNDDVVASTSAPAWSSDPPELVPVVEPDDEPAEVFFLNLESTDETPLECEWELAVGFLPFVSSPRDGGGIYYEPSLQNDFEIVSATCINSCRNEQRRTAFTFLRWSDFYQFGEYALLDD